MDLNKLLDEYENDLEQEDLKEESHCGLLDITEKIAECENKLWCDLDVHPCFRLSVYIGAALIIAILSFTIWYFASGECVRDCHHCCP